MIRSNGTNAATDFNDSLISFNKNGFSLGNDGNWIVNRGPNQSSGTSGLPADYVAWCWKAAGISTINTKGSITSLTNANPEAGFSIVKYTGNGNSSATIGHGLSSPEMLIIKNLSSPDNWIVYNQYANASPASGFLQLNQTTGFYVDSNAWGGGSGTQPTNTLFTIGDGGTDGYTNKSNSDYIAYCFTSITGYQKIGSYSGNQSLNTPNQINFGFTPRFVMIKNSTTNVSQWMLFDSARTNGMALYANQASAESDYTTDLLLSSQGLEFKSTNINVNQSGATYIYLAIA